MFVLSDALKLERPLIGLDTETTGTNPRSSRIVELALEIFTPTDTGTVTVREYRTYLNPGRPIPPSATAVHHITDDMVKNAPTFAQLADNLLRGFANADFCGFNVRFDLRMLAAEFTRNKRLWDYEGARVIDSFRLWQVAEKRSLSDAVKRFIPAEDQAELAGEAHTALGDTRWSTRVAAGMLRAFPTLPRNIQMLHDLCSPGWYDAEGKLQWRGGELCMGFGEHKDVPLRSVPRTYYDFILRKDFSIKVKDCVRAAMRGEFPTPPAMMGDAE